jgi:hypothetical protein
VSHADEWDRAVVSEALRRTAAEFENQTSGVLLWRADDGPGACYQTSDGFLITGSNGLRVQYRVPGVDLSRL